MSQSSDPKRSNAFVPARWRIEDQPLLVPNFTLRSTHQLYVGEGKGRANSEGDGFFTLSQTYSNMPTKQLSKAAVEHLENRKGKIIK